MPRVTATFELHFDEPGDVTGILDCWSTEEIAGLLSGNSEALDELASQGWQAQEPTDCYVVVNRAEVEAYLAARNGAASRRGHSDA